MLNTRKNLIEEAITTRFPSLPKTKHRKLTKSILESQQSDVATLKDTILCIVSGKIQCDEKEVIELATKLSELKASFGAHTANDPYSSSDATDESVDSTSSNKELRKQKRLEKKKMKDVKKVNMKPSSAEPLDEFVDDDLSAWQERLSAGKAWGGRGYGGRGVRGDVNTASNIHLSNVTLQFAGNELLQNSTIQINGGHRYGLLGRNGVGKSTLLRRLASKAIPGIPRYLRILLVKQQVPGDANKTALETLLESNSVQKELLDEQKALEEELDNGNIDDEIVERLGEIAAELDAMDTDRAETKARDILAGLQFTEEMMSSSTESLSGGWRMRLALAQSLFVPCDLLLLDEPTNHLDLHALDWLMNHLRKSNQTLIVVSHDRAFLDICTDIVTFQHKKLKYYAGNYSAYVMQQEEKAARQAQILDATERQRIKAMAFIEKQQQKQKGKGVDPNKQRQAKMIKEKKLERIGNYREDGKRYKQFSLATLSMKDARFAQKVEIEADEPVVNMKFPNPTWPTGVSDGSPMIKMDEFSFGYGDDLLIRGLTLDLARGSKVAMVGRNGAGKSTLLKLLIGEISPTADHYKSKGNIWRHPSLRIGHVNQYSIESLEVYEHMTVIEYAESFIKPKSAFSQDLLQKHHGNVRQYLGAFGLGGKIAHRHIRSMSGGERMRLCLATVLSEQPHMLALDEPTNHLDLETVDSLSKALGSYKGIVLIVSHNQSFLSGFAESLWVVQDGKVDVRQDESFNELFSAYRNLEISGTKKRNTKRQTKANLAKKALVQRSGARAGTALL